MAFARERTPSRSGSRPGSRAGKQMGLSSSRLNTADREMADMLRAELASAPRPPSALPALAPPPVGTPSAAGAKVLPPKSKLSTAPLPPMPPRSLSRAGASPLPPVPEARAPPDVLTLDGPEEAARAKVVPPVTKPLSSAEKLYLEAKGNYVQEKEELAGVAPTPERPASELLDSLTSKQLFALARSKLTEEESSVAAALKMDNMSNTLSLDSEKGTRYGAAAREAAAAVGDAGLAVAPGVSISEYNRAVRSLKNKLYQKGKASICMHFQALDLDRSGQLEREEFQKALGQFNLGIDQKVADALMTVVDSDRNGTVDYTEFTDALRHGRIKYMDTEGRKKYGPDPDLPFGDPSKQLGLPWGIMHDADANLRAFDERVNAKYRSLEETFKRFDEDASGEVDMAEFTKAMQSMKLELSDREIKNLFRNADIDGSGSISYEEFVKSFQGGGGKRFIPEFLKPKIARRSQSGHPWAWVPEARDPQTF